MEKEKSLGNLGKTDESLSPKDPSPADLEEFLPWAAVQFGFSTPICVSRKYQVSPIVKGKKSTKDVKGEKPLDLRDIKPEKLSSSSDDSIIIKNAVNIVLTYQAEDLVHILFEKTKLLPREVLQLIGIVLEFNPHLAGITINCGIDKYTVHELNKFLYVTNITEICLSDTFVKEANYALLLNEPNSLQVLSLARCRIGDQALKEIADKLHYPLPASKKLITLNLSSNGLTDKSAMYLATALRTNRKLSYLNIASNMITDKGGEAILNVFKPFPITIEEQLDFKHRYMNFLKIKHKMIEEYIADVKTGADKKFARRDKKSSVLYRKKEEMTDKQAEEILYEKAKNFVEVNLGEFDDPMTESFIENNWRYSKGNNSLVYLNIAYNHLSQCFLTMLVKVLQYQQTTDKRIKGLMNIRLEGNPIPETCTELVQIESFIEYGFSILSLRKGSVFTRKLRGKVYNTT